MAITRYTLAGAESGTTGHKPNGASTMSILTQASRQWMSRPADERFTSLIDLHNANHDFRQRSIGKTLSTRAIQAVPLDNRSMNLVGPNGAPVDMTHYAFGQLATKAGAPAGYLRSMPAPIAADCINFGLQFKSDIQDIGILLHKPAEGPAELRALTGPNYGRVWNQTITESLVDRFGDGITGHFRVPGEFGRKVKVTKENTTLFRGDRNMFVFLADEEHRIEIPNRRDGQPGSLARGFFVWNSEVGAETFGVATFLFDYVCANRIVWGSQEYREMRIRHTASAPDKWIHEVAPAIEKYAASSTDSVVKAIKDARANKIGDEDAVTAFLAKRFTKTQVKNIQAAHMQDEQRPIETLWDAATGVTAYARAIQYQDDRVELERAAGKIIDLAVS